MDKSKKLYKQALQAGLIACTILAIGLIASFWTYRYSLKNAVANEVSQTQIQEYFKKSLPERAALQKLPYKLVMTEDLRVNAGACVVLDTSNNCIIYQKNQNAIIPPASTTSATTRSPAGTRALQTPSTRTSTSSTALTPTTLWFCPATTSTRWTTMPWSSITLPTRHPAPSLSVLCPWLRPPVSAF